MTDALVVTSSFLPGRGGIESYLAALCEEVAPRLAVMAPRERDGLPLPMDLPYRTVPGPPLMLVPRPTVARAIVDAAGEIGVERVVFGTPWPLVLVAPALARAGIVYSIIAHGAELVAPSVAPGVSWRLAQALEGADALFAVSDYTANKMTEFLSRRGRQVPPVDILRARVDVERFRTDLEVAEARERYGVGPDDKVILCFGRLVARKGIDRLIAALPAIRRRVPEAVLVVAGTGPQEDDLKKKAAEVGRVIFTGRVPAEVAPNVYAMADVFALAVVDRYRGLEIEGLGIVLLEAAACGVPCVTGRSGGTPEAVVDGSTGFVIDATDPAQLVDRIAGLLENPHLAKQMGEAGRKHVIEHFYETSRLRPLLEWLG